MKIDQLPLAERQRLEELAKLHHVAFELTPAVVSKISEGLKTIGYDLTLAGTHGDQGNALPSPGCSRCGSVWADLAEIARVVLPPSDRASSYDIRPFDHSLHMAPVRHMRPDVELVIEVRHRRGYFEAPDACETECVKEMVEDLRALGIRERVAS
jgi:hypothetical protein